MATIQLNCENCKQVFDKEIRHFNYQTKLGYTKLYCSQNCQRNAQNISQQMSCACCGKTLIRKPSEITSNNFCGLSCSAKFNNTNRSVVHKLVPKTCVYCNKVFSGYYGIPVKSAKCIKCKKSHDITRKKLNEERHLIKQLKLPRSCKDCGDEFYSKWYKAKYCIPCRNKRSQTRRSKNEIMFAELCEGHFDEVLCNNPMFNGWDADVILPKLKIAVLWDGQWHFSTTKIKSNHSPAQMRNKDKFKRENIEKCGYIHYTVKDPAKHNPKFVLSEFQKFLKFVSDRSDWKVSLRL
jgi:hypothetical protein